MPQPRITIASYITISRFFLVPIFIYLFLKGYHATAIVVLGIAAFTDLLDGFLARHFSMRSRLGSLLDPMADKFLMVVSFVVLTWKDRIPFILTFIVLGKDFIVTAGVCILNLMRVKLYYRPTILSKFTTASQIFVLIFSFMDVFLEKNPLVLPEAILSLVDPVKTTLMYTAGVLTVGTAAQYVFIGYKFYRYGERKNA